MYILMTIKVSVMAKSRYSVQPRRKIIPHVSSRIIITSLKPSICKKREFMRYTVKHNPDTHRLTVHSLYRFDHATLPLQDLHTLRDRHSLKWSKWIRKHQKVRFKSKMNRLKGNKFRDRRESAYDVQTELQTLTLPSINSHCSFPKDLSGTTSRSNMIVLLKSFRALFYLDNKRIRGVSCKIFCKIAITSFRP